MIDRGTQIGRPGAPRRSDTRVMTAPARLRLLRDAENPWYEMVLIEGRNREIRKMFEEVGHHVEKIRRVGYGPLVLDLEPGRTRELTHDEVAALRRAAEGKGAKPAKKTPKPGKKPDFRSKGPRSEARQHSQGREQQTTRRTRSRER
jgi:23S rRNA pseudouridine2605 synthase